MRDVLIVDDDAVVRQSLSAILGAKGHAVHVAANAFEALMELRIRAFHVIVSDVKMPYVEGTSFYRQVVAEFPELAKRFVFLTGSTTPASIVAETGRPCLAKPFDATEIIGVVEAVAESAADR